jgi:alpha-galactosidase
MDLNIKILHTETKFDLHDFRNEIWKTVEKTPINKFWSGETAPPERSASARLLWNDEALFTRFDCEQHEPFVLTDNPRFDAKTDELWEQDVCELFLAPDKQNYTQYFEFEVAPTGEWLDLEIQHVSNQRQTNWNYCSNIKTASEIYATGFRIAFQIPWLAFGEKPKNGDYWLGNLFRCVGSGATRGYLAWRPTLTEKPNFHVPQAFGKFIFVKM